MSFAPSPSQFDILQQLRNFLLSVLPADTEVVLGYDNRVPEPKASNYVVLLVLMRERLETNSDSYQDVFYTGAIAGTQLTVSAVAYGAFLVGQPIFGVNVPTGLTITAFGTGTGGVGTYTLSGDGGTIPAQAMASGQEVILQPIRLVVQCDVHGPAGGDYAQTISTLFRDLYACDYFAAAGPDIQPLFADDPRLVPYLNEGQQVENRWIVTTSLQANQRIRTPQQFADELVATLFVVEAEFPAV